MGRSYGRGPSRRDVPQVEVEVYESSQDSTDETSAPLGPLTTSATETVTDGGRPAGDRPGPALSAPVRSTSLEPSPLCAAGDDADSPPPDSPGQWEVFQDFMGGGSCGSSDASSTSSQSSPSSSSAGDSSDYDGELEVGAAQPCFRTQEQFFGFLLRGSQAHFTEDGYNILRSFHDKGRPAAQALPSASTVRGKITSRALQVGGLPVEVSTSPAFTYVLPSSHVRRDLSFEDTFAKFHAAEYAADQRDGAQRGSIQEYYDTPLFQNRAAWLLSDNKFSSFVLCGRLVRIGDRLDVELRNGSVVSDLVVSEAFFAGADQGLQPDDGVHAGDLVVRCEQRGCEAGLVVARHWCPSTLDALVWIESEQSVAQPAKKVDVTPTTVDGGVRGGGPATAGGGDRQRRSIFGVDKDGVPTVTVSMAFYIDGFTLADGVYMLYPGFRVEDRVSRHAVRVISIVNKGIDSDEVLKAITGDLVKGTTEGWLVADWEGRPVRALADVACFIGDYVQVSKSCRLRGHNAIAPCTLCGYTKGTGDTGVYGGGGSSVDAELVRTAARTEAVLRAVRALRERGRA